MPFGVDERLHIVRVEVKVLVIERDDVWGSKSQKVEKSLLVDLCMKRNSPIILPVAIPIPTREKFCHIMHLLHVFGRIGQFIAKCALEFVLVFGVCQNVFAVVQNLGIRIEQDTIKFTL